MYHSFPNLIHIISGSLQTICIRFAICSCKFRRVTGFLKTEPAPDILNDKLIFQLVICNFIIMVYRGQISSCQCQFSILMQHIIARWQIVDIPACGSIYILSGIITFCSIKSAFFRNISWHTFSFGINRICSDLYRFPL